MVSRGFLPRRSMCSFVPAGFLVLFCCSSFLHAQQTSASNSNVPTVRFSKEQAASPQRFTVEIDSSGDVRYQSWDTKDAEDSYSTEFHASAETVKKVFGAARNANYFQGAFDFTAHKVADLGKKTLAYSDGVKKTSTTYNWSENGAIQSVTGVFEGISNVLESGVRIETKRRFDPLGVDAELKAVEDAQQNGKIVELQAIAPVLKKVANDPQIMNITRDRARRLLQTSRAMQQSAGPSQGE